MKMMKQQLMTAPGQITFREVPVPQVGPDQVLVKIKKIGICGSDIHVYITAHIRTRPTPSRRDTRSPARSWSSASM